MTLMKCLFLVDYKHTQPIAVNIFLWTLMITTLYSVYIIIIVGGSGFIVKSYLI